MGAEVRHKAPTSTTQAPSPGQGTGACSVSGTSPRYSHPKWIERDSDADALQTEIGLHHNGDSIRIGILNRKYSRRLTHLESILARVKCEFPDAIVNATTFDRLDLREQAAWIHSQDILISPHGAQLVNMIFARKCTAVLELFPRHYRATRWFIPLALNVGLCAFAGYSMPLDLQMENVVSSNLQTRARARDPPIETTADVIARAIPFMLKERDVCLKEGSCFSSSTQSLKAMDFQ
jgi:hypothetical protein